MKPIRLILLLVLLGQAVPGFPWKAVGHRLAVDVAMMGLDRQSGPGEYLMSAKRRNHIKYMVTWPDNQPKGDITPRQNEPPQGHSLQLDKRDSSGKPIAIPLVVSGEQLGKDVLSTRLLRWLLVGTYVVPPPAGYTAEEKRLAYLGHYAADLCCPVHARRGLDLVDNKAADDFHGKFEQYVENCIGAADTSAYVQFRTAVDSETKLMAELPCPTEATEAQLQTEIVTDLKYTFNTSGKRLADRTHYRPPTKVGDRYQWQEWTAGPNSVKGMAVRDLARSALTIRKYWIMSWRAA
jgi:hypothetical protein